MIDKQEHAFVAGNFVSAKKTFAGVIHLEIIDFFANQFIELRFVRSK